MLTDQSKLFKLISKIFLAYSFSLCLMYQACIPVTEKSNTTNVTDLAPAGINLQDSAIRNLMVAQNDQDLNRLYSYFSSTNPSIRYAAALAVGSVRNQLSADTLAYLLKDANIHVASAAAYSLGLLGKPSSQDALLSSFRQYDTAGINSTINSAILEAVGRVGSAEFLKAMATVETYKPTDTLLLLGQIRGIYRYMLRGIIDSAGTHTAVNYLGNVYPHEVRLMAAHYLARAKNLNLGEYTDVLLNTFKSENDGDVKLALTLAIGKTKSEPALALLKEVINTDVDGRFGANALRSLSNYDYSQIKSTVIPALKNKNLSIASTAILYLQEHGKSSDGKEYRELARDNYPWQVKIPLLGLANKFLDPLYAIAKSSVAGELKSIYGNTENLSQKAACIKAIGTDSKNIGWLLETGKQSSLPVIQSAIMDASMDLIKNKSSMGDAAKQDVINYVYDKVSTGDGAALEIIESAAKEEITKSLLDVTKIESIKSGLVNNAYAQYMLSKTINSLKGNTDALPSMNDYKKLNAAEFALNGIGNYAEIVTDKGNIKLHLLKEAAPATVANFVRLAKAEFYNNKIFHRVVPNFVIQGGCPRGDGYGSAENSIRSETPPIYYNKAGMVGMASAGNHTESCQFFITHSPTPHLDGNYTIFAEVVSGMEVVNAIQIGDKIQRINFTD